MSSSTLTTRLFTESKELISISSELSDLGDERIIVSLVDSKQAGTVALLTREELRVLQANINMVIQHG